MSPRLQHSFGGITATPFAAGGVTWLGIHLLTKALTNRVTSPVAGLAASLVASLVVCALLALPVSVRAQTPTAAAIDLSHVPKLPSASPLPAGWQHGAFMEIFVRAYKDSDADGIGDLRGLTQRLDYLQDLGIKGIWLMPVTASADHDHGYATTDFRAIEPAYGTLADFDELLTQAHARGIGVIIDYVINHAAKSHPLFAQAQSGPTSAFRNWFVWQKTAPTGWDIWGKDPWTATEGGAYFATFGPHMPDFNFRNPKVLAYHEDSLRFWLNRGLDGVRLDAVPHLIENSAKNWNDQPQSRALTRRLQRLITHYPRRYVVCEATAKPEIYGSKKVCGSAFAFGHQNNIVAAAKAPDAAATDADLAKRRAAIQSVAHYFEKAPPNMATMVSNHDAFAGLRLWDQVGGDLAAYRLAAATYLLQPGTPFIYYGEEVGMAGTPGLQGDSPLRGPMSWTADAAGFTSGTPFRAVSANAATHNVAAQVGDAASIHSFYKSMLSLRNTLPSIVRGSYARAFVQGEVIGFQRRLGQEKTWVLINYGTQAASVSVAKAGALSHWLAQYPRASEALLADAKGGLKVLLPAQSVQVYLLQYK